MTEPMNDFERRLAEGLRHLTDEAPRRVDFAEEARLIAARPGEPRPRWRRVLPLAIGTAALAAVVTLVILDSAPFNRPPAGSASPSPSGASVSPEASASSVPAAEIDLSRLPWYDLTDMSYGTLTNPQPDATPLPPPYGQLRVGTLDGHLAAELQLEEISFANGPYAAGVLAGQDNGTRSEILLVSPLTGEVRSVFRTDSLVPIAALSPDGAWVYYPKIDRSSGRDTGLWRRPMGDGREELMVEAGIDQVPYDFALPAGSVWFMGWTPDRSTLAVQSCDRSRCDAIAYHPANGQAKRLGEVTGELLDLTDTELVARHSRAPGVVAVDLGSGAVRTIDPAAHGGAIARGESGWFLAYEPELGSVRAYRLQAVSVEGGGSRLLVELGADDLSLASVSAPGDRRAILPQGWVLRWPVRGGLYSDLRVDPATWFAGELVNVETGETVRVPPVADNLPQPDCAPIPPAELPSGAAPGETRITDASGFRFATWGDGPDLITQIVGGTLFAANAGPETVPVAIRETTGNLSPSVSPDGPFFVTWQENGCSYELWLPTDLSQAESIEYASRY
jgi:hypothetical protein